MVRNHYHLSPYLAFILSFSVFIETTQAIAFPLPSRLSSNVYATDYTVGEADLMLPLAGDRRHNFYLDPNVAYGTDNQGYADLGLGYRWIKNDAAILGLYLFGGYTRIDNNARLWVANPGIEALGSRWDAHLNGYVTMGDRSYALGNSLGPFSFTGNSQVANLFQLTQYAGNGADIKLGYQFFPQSSLKGYVGSYFFNPLQPSNIWGGALGLEYWLDNHIKVFANYTYDNLRHSTGAFGLGVELGGTHTVRVNPTLEERITDPIERYLSDLSRGSAIPSRKAQLNLGQATISNNIAFFSQTDGSSNNIARVSQKLADCTFEHPCGPTYLTDVSASILNSLLPNTQMYFNGGSYSAQNIEGTAVTLQPGQSLSSRTADYSQPATGARRSIFNGALILNSNNTLNNIIIIPTASTASGNGILISNSTNIKINGSQIGSLIQTFSKGITFIASQGTITRSSLNSSNVSLGALNNSNALIENSVVNVINAGNSMSSAALFASSNSVLTMNNSFAVMTGNTSGKLSAVLTQNASVNINQSTINITSNNNVATTFVLFNTGDGSISVQRSSLNLQGGSARSSRIIEPTGATHVLVSNSSCIQNSSARPCM